MDHRAHLYSLSLNHNDYFYINYDCLILCTLFWIVKVGIFASTTTCVNDYVIYLIKIAFIKMANKSYRNYFSLFDF